MAPEVAQTIERLKREKTLQLEAGVAISAAADSEGVDVKFRYRGSSAVRTARFSWVVNCTGPGFHTRAATHAFLRPLLESGTLCGDELGLGILTDSQGCAVRPDGSIHPDLLIAGTLRKATLWESTAVPELRQQAGTAAQTALSLLLSHTAMAQSRA
jgi:uncharacterized NAD(P)/FAD-binding protein YdhS